MNNKLLGNQFEIKLANTLSDHDFWVFRTPNKYYGQPTDIIAIKKNKGFLIECKVCTNDYLDVRRIAFNQFASIQRFEDCGNQLAFFAIEIKGATYMIDYKYLKSSIEKLSTRKRIPTSEIIDNAFKLERWLELCMYL